MHSRVVADVVHGKRRRKSRVVVDLDHRPATSAMKAVTDVLDYVAAHTYGVRSLTYQHQHVGGFILPRRSDVKLTDAQWDQISEVMGSNTPEAAPGAMVEKLKSILGLDHRMTNGDFETFVVWLMNCNHDAAIHALTGFLVKVHPEVTDDE